LPSHVCLVENGIRRDDDRVFMPPKAVTMLLNQLKSPLFRIGQGTRKGYGKLAVISCKTKVFDLTTPDGFEDYLDFDNSLNSSNSCLQEIADLKNNEKLLHYELKLKPENFFIFGAGFGDNEVDNIPVTEDVITYDKEKIRAPQKMTLIPASSIKGALSHRTAFHYNRKTKRFADNYANEIKENTKELMNFVETNNNAVFELFGAEEGLKNRHGQRGKIIINDILLSNIKNENLQPCCHRPFYRWSNGRCLV